MGDRPLCLLIGALGGQGGGVLIDWLVDAAQAAGYPAQATSIPGVAQRTGATTYYFELFPERDPPGTPVFSLFPAADDLDLMAALEPTEAGRALEKGWITRRTTVLTTTRRIYSTAEKSLAGDGRVDPLPVLDALTRACKALLVLEPPAGAQVNATMLGAIAGTGILPLSAEDLRGAIERRGLAVASNLDAFAAGLAMAGEPAAERKGPEPLHYEPAPAVFAGAVSALPAELRPIVGHALSRLLDYQDADYARLYLDRLRPVLELDDAARGYRLAQETARRLGAWMSYEDVLRVAQLKTRPGRLARIRREIGAGDDEPLLVYDYFKPRLQEISAILPRALGGWMRGLGESPAGSGLSLRWPTATPLGYGLLKLLAWMRRWRGAGQGYRHEQEAMEAWLAAVRKAARADYELACATAGLAVWARGYGPVRSRGLEHLGRLWPTYEDLNDARLEGLGRTVAESLRAARERPEQPPRPAAGG